MRTLGAVAILGLLAGAWAKVLPNIRRPPCDSHEAEEAALIAQDYINSHHEHCYKFILNQIDEIKIIEKPDGGETYLMEVDLLETTCHIFDPTPVANCSVREKHLMHIDADCDVALTKEKGVLAVKAYKCKSKPDSREYPCAGCINLVHLNHTEALEVVDESLVAYNNKSADNPDQAHFALLEVTRLSSQIVGGGPKYFAEFAIIETNCTVHDKDSCHFLNHTVARKGFCVAEKVGDDVDVDCRVFETVANATHHQHHHEHHQHGITHHKLKHRHDSSASSLLSESDSSSASSLLSESDESGEVPEVMLRCFEKARSACFSRASLQANATQHHKLKHRQDSSASSLLSESDSSSASSLLSESDESGEVPEVTLRCFEKARSACFSRASLQANATQHHKLKHRHDSSASSLLSESDSSSASSLLSESDSSSASSLLSESDESGEVPEVTLRCFEKARSACFSRASLQANATQHHKLKHRQDSSASSLLSESDSSSASSLLSESDESGKVPEVTLRCFEKARSACFSRASLQANATQHHKLKHRHDSSASSLLSESDSSSASSLLSESDSSSASSLLSESDESGEVPEVTLRCFEKARSACFSRASLQANATQHHKLKHRQDSSASSLLSESDSSSASSLLSESDESGKVPEVTLRCFEKARSACFSRASLQANATQHHKLKHRQDSSASSLLSESDSSSASSLLSESDESGEVPEVTLRCFEKARSACFSRASLQANATHHQQHHEHHKLKHRQDSSASSLLSESDSSSASSLLSESDESGEVPEVKHENVGIPPAPTNAPVVPVGAVVPHCPGKIRFY